MGKVIYPRKGEVHTVPVTFPAVFADANWEQIIEACESGSVPDTWIVGDQKAMTINGTDYLIDIIGKNQDTYTAGGTAPLTFQMHDCYGTKYAMNRTNTNVGGWTDCAMRNTHLPAILALMPSEVRSGIKAVKKQTSAGNVSSTINTTSDKLFLLAENEVYGKLSNSPTGEGVQYAYYAAGNSTIKYLSGSVNGWWTRSPRSSNSTNFCCAYASGAAGHNSASASYGVSFAFCF